MVFAGEIGGFPTDWIVGFVIVLILGLIVAAFLALRGGGESTIEANNGLIIPIDEHGTIQEATLVTNIRRTETDIVIENPEWEDEKENTYTASLDITSGGGTKVPIPYHDAGSPGQKKLWLILDQGDLTTLSWPTLIRGMPKRWDPPMSDRRKSFRFLISAHPGQSITNALTTPLGILTLIGLLGGGMLLGFFLVTVSGHLH